MPTISLPNVRIAGLAAAVPVLQEFDWAELDLKEGQFAHARRRAEMPWRRKARPEQCQSDFCVAAAEKLLADLNWQASDVDAVIMATLTADYPIPATAIIVQDRLGVPKSAVAFDLPTGGLGFLHGLQVLASMMSGGFLKRGLLLTGEVSKTPESSDAALPYRAMHGHNGCVCALEFSPGSAMIFDSGGDGSLLEAVYMPVGGVRNPPRAEMFCEAEGVQFASEFHLDAAKIDLAARRELPSSARRTLELAGCSMNDLDAAYVSPLSLPVEADLRNALEIPFDLFHSFIPEFGGGGSGSIPLAMLARSASRLRSSRQRSLLIGVGPGLAWGSAVLETEHVICPDIIEM